RHRLRGQPGAAHARTHRLRRHAERRGGEPGSRPHRALRRAPAARTTRLNFTPVPELLEDIRKGAMVLIVDDEDRENEGDLIMAAELVRPADINFMVTHARGLV